jgi:hypothetical protein
MSTRSTLSALTATAIASAGLVAAQDAAAATGSFSCSAAAISGTVLGQAITPVAGAGGDGPCQTADGTSAFTTPLGGSAIAKTLLSGATGDVGAQRATSTAGVQGLAVGGLSSLLPALPAASLPAGLSALEIPLPVVAPVISGVTGVTGSLGGLLGWVTGTTGTGTGSTTGSLLPSKITVDALDAVKALVPAGTLPNLDLLKLDGLTSTATAACQAGTAVLRGVTDIAGLQSLGQPLPVDQAVSRVVALADPQNIPVGGLDLSLVKLPAGLRFDDPVVGLCFVPAAPHPRPPHDAAAARPAGDRHRARP